MFTMMRVSKTELAILGIAALLFVIGGYFYPHMPERIASHWNAQGQVDGYISKFWGLFLMPLVCVGLSLLLIAIPRIDPLRANIERFKGFYFSFAIMLLLFMLYLYVLTILWNLGVRFNMIRLLVPAFAVLYFYCGILVEKAKRNWFIGIRTPWTLSSDVVWDKTHKIGGKLFKVAGILVLLGLIFPNHAILFVLCPVILVALTTTVYSYFEYSRETKTS